jgi:hypothetical protein
MAVTDGTVVTRRPRLTGGELIEALARVGFEVVASWPRRTQDGLATDADAHACAPFVWRNHPKHSMLGPCEVELWVSENG